LNPEVSPHAALIEAPDDPESIDALYRARRWSDGLPIVPPTQQRVTSMLRHAGYEPGKVIARLAPGYGEATVERIAVNAVMAGCAPEFLPVVISAVEAVAAPEFNLQAIQATTNPVAVWVIVNGPAAARLHVNATHNCLGQGVWANATIGRALRLCLQNLGGALPGEMDRATQGQPGKYTFCCAENEAANPWTPLHVERGYASTASTVTVVGAEGTMNMNTHAKTADELARVIAGADSIDGGRIVVGGQHDEHRFHRRHANCSYRVPQHGLAGERCVLLGRAAGEARAAAGRGDQGEDGQRLSCC